ncbi:HK97 family phage prohead protease [Pinibacter soli]|uniref:HK97 family phage prohead protease n=1 Tax=Pinibacter soli TaxID=3044211 RepID=A0ABT6R9A8_9BACT|nr:HK97 family phage prohead protease [Pinibacter soli]MDI3319135.1 HK97 family phage prohead protease [Pinibacter soli]
MAFKKRFLISDESVNTYGFAVRTAGIRLDNAMKNCPAFYEHDTDEVPLGHWENFTVEGIRLYADLVIEGANDIERTYIRKIQNGDMKGASIGADPITWNGDPQQLLQGQTLPWLEECDLFEVSLTALPGNKNALALKKDGAVIKLNSTNAPLFIKPLKKEEDMKQIALKLGLPENATEQQIIDAVASIQLSQQSTTATQQKIIEQLSNELEGDQKVFFVKLSKTSLPDALEFLTLSQKKLELVAEPIAPATTTVTGKVVKDVPVSTLLNKSALIKKEEGEDNEGKNTFDYLQKFDKAELSRISKEEPARYTQLTADYGKGIRYTGKGK